MAPIPPGMTSKQRRRLRELFISPSPVKRQLAELTILSNQRPRIRHALAQVGNSRPFARFLHRWQLALSALYIPPISMWLHVSCWDAVRREERLRGFILYQRTLERASYEELEMEGPTEDLTWKELTGFALLSAVCGLVSVPGWAWGKVEGLWKREEEERYPELWAEM
jgi:hypothetical protein